MDRKDIENIINTGLTENERKTLVKKIRGLVNTDDPLTYQLTNIVDSLICF